MDVSVVCPFYNEAEGLEHAVRQMLEQLCALEGEWELILVNDGSTDDSGAIEARLARLAAESPRVRILGYPENRGRGYALRTGITAARGELVVTTEIDLSWGARIVHELVRELREHPECDIVIASPHLPGGGYRNVPAHRVWISRLGNLFIRACMPGAVTMNTGMTRAYRRASVRSLPLQEEGKEFHVEIIAVAHALGLKIREIPAVLEWQDPQRALRKSKRGLLQMACTHVWFALRARRVQAKLRKRMGRET